MSTSVAKSGTKQDSVTKNRIAKANSRTPVVRQIPPLTELRRIRPPRATEKTLPSGLRVIAIRKPGIPVVEVRLRVPFASADRASFAKARLMEETMLKGTSTYSALDFEQQLGLLGAAIEVAVDRDKLRVGGMTLSEQIGRAHV